MAFLSSVTLYSLPTEVLEQIAFFCLCPRVLGPPQALTPLLLTCKAVYSKLIYAKAEEHLYARVFRFKFSFSAIRRRGFEPRAGEWASQLRWWCRVLRSIRRRRRAPDELIYIDNSQDEAEAGIQEIMYALWIMCLEDDGCNRLQMQLAGVYEWVQGWIRHEMYRGHKNGWPVANAANSCAMCVFWYLTTKARLIEETEDQRESIVNLVLPFLTVPFRYPAALAPANHFRLPLRLSASSSTTSAGPSSIPTPHGPYPIYIQPSQYTWHQPHYDRWISLTTPLASDAAKLVYFSRRETLLFPSIPMLPRNRAEHRAAVRARLMAAAGGGAVSEYEVERAVQSELPRPTREDFEEMNQGLLGGEMVPPSSSPSKGGGTALPLTYDRWDDVRRAAPALLNPSTSFSDANLDEAERILSSDDSGLGFAVDESSCQSRRWDSDWWRLRLCRSAWAQNQDKDRSEEEEAKEEMAVAVEDDSEDVLMDLGTEDNEVERNTNEYDDAATVEAEGEDDGEDDLFKDTEDMDNERSSTMFTGYPQKGALYTPGELDGLWVGRMMIPAEAHLRALLLPPAPAPAPIIPAQAQVPAAAANPNPNPNAIANDAHDDPNPNPNPIPAAAAPVPPLPPFAAPPQAPREAGHRPRIFTEDTLGLVAVPVFVRFKEYAVYSGGEDGGEGRGATVPCANDTESKDEEDDGGQERGRRRGRGRTDDESTFDQGIRDAWFPPNATVLPRGDSVLVSVPPQSTQSTSASRGREEEYEYVAVNSAGDRVSNTHGNPNPKSRKPGTFHDPDTCPGCRAKEEVLKTARMREELQSLSQSPSPSSSQTGSGDDTQEESQPSNDLPSYVPSLQTLPACTGIRDVLITGSTDKRHADAWGKWVWKGRVRKWDGLIGLVRSPGSGPAITSPSGGKIFFYGTLLGGRNFVGTWRLAHEDPRMPAYEGAFTLGKKDE